MVFTSESLRRDRERPLPLPSDPHMPSRCPCRLAPGLAEARRPADGPAPWLARYFPKAEKGPRVWTKRTPMSIYEVIPLHPVCLQVSLRLHWVWLSGRCQGLPPPGHRPSSVMCSRTGECA